MRMLVFLLIFAVVVVVLGAGIEPNSQKKQSGLVQTQSSSPAGGRPAETLSVLGDNSRGFWEVSSERSKIDDSTNVYARLTSLGTFQSRFGRERRAVFWVVCREDRTSAFFEWPGNYMSDFEYGRVTFRIDEETAFTRKLRESSNNEALGFWSGGTSIPFVRSLVGKRRLLVRATPYKESSITLVFPIWRIEKALGPLAKACHWSL